MCRRIFSMKELSENDEEWHKPSNIVQTKANISATKRELLTRIYRLETKNQVLQKRLGKRSSELTVNKVCSHAEEEDPKDKRIRELSFENQTLREQIQKLEKTLVELVKIEVRLPECAVCWERDQCTGHSHGDNCLVIGFVIDTAKEAAKEAKNEN